jgi:acetyl-CoA synthetase
MTRGYTLSEPTTGEDDPWDGFDWRLGESYNIATVALSAAGAAPERTALRHRPTEGRVVTLSYGELDSRSDAVAASLRDHGVARGDRVGVCLPQCPEAVVTHLAAFKLGAVVVPLSMLLGAESFEYALEHTGTSMLVVDQARVGDLESEPDAPTTVTVEPGNYERSTAGGLAPYASSGATVSTAPTSPDTPALILYTSGTTGTPDGVVQGHEYLAGSLPGYQAWFHLFGDTVARDAQVWTPGEWAWAGALFDVVFPTLAVGGTVVSRERRSGFDPKAALALLDDAGVTHAFMPATALRQIRRNADPIRYDLSSLAVVMSGGESLPDSLGKWATRRLAPTVHEAYGQTEANALVGECTAAYASRSESMGRAYPGHDVRVVDEDGDEVSPDDLGEIAVGLPDPVVFQGYWRDDVATEEAFRDDLFLTGDLAVRDAEGYFYHRGRKDDLIVTAGYRVSPLEVEAVLESHQTVADVVVGGVADPERGERVKAVVVPADETAPGDAESLGKSLRHAVRAELGAHKVPREGTFVDALPETRSGKTDRSALFD